ncbi:hypothetical protein B0H34DRAFT_653630 [Crassisporium funariophilum]|nr:hypothetical protein B0H34DRAFT_653630 [Crassisporium funariophilum]
MAKHPLSLPMSQIIACDAPLLSPVGGDHQWDIQQPLFSPTADFNYGYYNLPPSPPSSEGSHSTGSPIPTSRMLKMRMSPASSTDSEQLCMPTHQVFDFPEVARPPTPPSRSPSLGADCSLPLDADSPNSSIASCGAKRSASPAPSATKKRAVGERINSKDFIPPDVSGLSKREARLVKNRAAAFLSRQRKREEFECMEVRVAELEQENARLLALAQNGNSISAPQQAQSDTKLVSEVEQLKAELAAAKERERSLSAQLLSTASAREAPIKIEATEPQFSLSSPPRSTVPSAHKSGASLGLMVLLCALPTLLSMRMESTAPTSFAIPNPFPTSSASTFDYSSILPNEFDWSKATAGSLMDYSDDRNTIATTRKLELTGADVAELGGLGGLDISFDASPSDDGKIRVRIHPSSTASSRSASPGASYTSLKPDMSPSSSSLAMWSGSDSEPSFQASFSTQGNSKTSFSTSSSDPFLGVPSSDYDIPFNPDAPMTMYDNMDESMALNYDYGQLSDPTFGLGSEYNIPDSNGGKRRVRIALKSMPQAGGEGGEWEVQIC